MAVASSAPNRSPDGDAVARRAGYAVPFGCLSLALAPFLIAHAEFLWLRSHYEFFPLVVVGAAFLARTRLRDSGHHGPGRTPVAVALVAFSWLLLAGGAAIFSPWLGGIGSLVTLLAVIYGIGGWKLSARMFPAWAFLWLLIPPPLGYDNDLILFLQRAVSRVNGPALDLLGIRHFMDGYVLVVAGRALEIGKSCSGILSLLPVLACTLFYVLWNELSWRRSIPLLVAAAAWDFVGNVARVLTIAVAFTTGGIDLSVGWPHEALGIVVFAIVLALTASTDFLLRFLGATCAYWHSRFSAWYRVHGPNRRWNPLATIYPEDEPPARLLSGDFDQVSDAPPARVPPAGPPSFPAPSRTWLSSWLIMGIYCLVGVAGASAFGPSTFDLLRAPRFISLFNSLREETLPARSGPFVLRAFEPTHIDIGAEHSRAWIYDWHGRTVAVAVDYPFRGWHELTECYENDAWRLEDSTVRIEPGSAGSPALELNEANFSRPDGRIGFLLFSSFDERGDRISRSALIPLSGHFATRMRAKLTNRRVRESLVPTFQVQFFTTSNAVLSDADQAEARVFFQEACRIIAGEIVRASARGAAQHEPDKPGAG